jgi:hypothetical protein
MQKTAYTSMVLQQQGAQPGMAWSTLQTHQPLTKKAPSATEHIASPTAVGWLRVW